MIPLLLGVIIPPLLGVMIPLLLAVMASPCVPTPTPAYSWRQTLDAIRIVETGGTPNDGRGAVGDGGAAIGPYQIHNIYHVDAHDRDHALNDYKRCLNSIAYSERVVEVYMSRYARCAVCRLRLGKGTLADVETIARIHNGGPKGASKKATLGYWAKVRREVTR